MRAATQDKPYKPMQRNTRHNILLPDLLSGPHNNLLGADHLLGYSSSPAGAHSSLLVVATAAAVLGEHH